MDNLPEAKNLTGRIERPKRQELGRLFDWTLWTSPARLAQYCENWDTSHSGLTDSNNAAATDRYLSLTAASKLFGLRAKPDVFDFFVSIDLLRYDKNKPCLTKKGEDAGGKNRFNEEGESWVVWNVFHIKPFLIECRERLLNQLPFESLEHITHVENVEGILCHGLRAHYNDYQKRDISNQQVNNRREKKETAYGRKVHEYVPLYLNSRNAMLFQVQSEYNDDILIISYKKNILLDATSVFSDQNAASKGADFTGMLHKVAMFDWNTVFSANWSSNGANNKHVKSHMMAECLVYEPPSVSEIDAIYCLSDHTKLKVENLAAASGLAMNVIVDRSKFF